MKRIILGFSVLSLCAQAQIVTEHDLTAAAVGGGSAALVYYHRQTQSEVNGIVGRAASRDAQVAQLLEEAKTYDSQRPKVNSVNLYEGRFAIASEYNRHAGEPAAMSNNQYRLQADGVKKIAEALAKDGRFNSGGVITVKIHRVYGTLNGQIQMGDTETLRGSIAEISEKMLSLATRQGPTQTPNSIVKVTAEYTEILAADPVKAANLRSKAEALKAQPETAEQIRARERLQVLKRWRTGGFIAIGTGLFLGMLRSAFAQEVMDLSEACLSEDALNTKTVGLSLSTGLSETRTRAEIVQLCSQLVER